MTAARAREAAPLMPASRVPLSGHDLVELSNRLAELLDKETTALAAMRLDDAGRLQPEKARLTRLYRVGLEELRAGRTTLANTAAALRAQLVAVSTRLGHAAAQNERALRAGRAAVERVVAAIAEAVTENRTRIAVYGPPRVTPARVRVVGGVALDRRL